MQLGFIALGTQLLVYVGVSLPQTANAAQLMQACAANGMAEIDHSAPVRALQLMAAREVAKA